MANSLSSILKNLTKVKFIVVYCSVWAVTGVCPGPIFAQIGTGVGVIAVTLLSAIAGTWIYGLFREKLPY